MKKFLLKGLVFVAFSAVSLFPLLRLTEMLLTRNVASDPPPYFPVLARSSQGKFVVVRLQDVSPQAHLVLEISDVDLDRINTDLSSQISKNQSTYAYVKIVGKGEGYTDVSLEVPSRGDFWFKCWYRIQDGAVHTQRILRYGPHMIMFAFPLSLLSGVAGVFCFNKIKKSFEATSPLQPPPPA